jgi:16S rRNA processing protein RimM
MMKADELIEVCRLGRTVGLKGSLKLHDLSDFPEQFKPKAVFYLESGETVTIAQYDKDKNLVRFEGINDQESASKLTNQFLKTTKAATKASCKLKEGEFFWFDIIGCEVVEEGVKIGVVDDIERIGSVNYLHVKTDDSFTEKGMQANFLIPYIDRFILHMDINAQKIITQDAIYFLE